MKMSRWFAFAVLVVLLVSFFSSSGFAQCVNGQCYVPRTVPTYSYPRTYTYVPRTMLESYRYYPTIQAPIKRMPVVVPRRPVAYRWTYVPQYRGYVQTPVYR